MGAASSMSPSTHDKFRRVAFLRVHHQCAAKETVTARIKQVLNSFDTDADGYLTAAEFHRAAEELGFSTEKHM
jgi:Ca2+-binding EF-hand superfamily protein